MNRIIVAVVWMIITYFMPGMGMGEIERKGENHENNTTDAGKSHTGR